MSKLPLALVRACRQNHVRPTRFILSVSVAQQRMELFERSRDLSCYWTFPNYQHKRSFRISTSRFGIGQVSGSNKTPLGLHCIGEKIGSGWPQGAVFKSRQLVGFTWLGHLDAPIAHRILWLEGLEPGFNRGGDVDTHSRYIYIHGLGDEPSLGRPASRGCIHMAASDLMPLFDTLPSRSLVWIGQ